MRAAAPRQLRSMSRPWAAACFGASTASARSRRTAGRSRTHSGRWKYGCTSPHPSSSSPFARIDPHRVSDPSCGGESWVAAVGDVITETGPDRVRPEHECIFRLSGDADRLRPVSAVPGARTEEPSLLALRVACRVVEAGPELARLRIDGRRWPELVRRLRFRGADPPAPQWLELGVEDRDADIPRLIR